MPSPSPGTAAPRARADLRRIGWLVASAALYLALAELAFVRFIPVTQAAAVGPLSAAAFAVCLLWGYGYSAWVFAAALALGMWSALRDPGFMHSLLWSCVGVASVTTLQAVLGAWMVRKWSGIGQPLLAALSVPPPAAAPALDPARTRELEEARTQVELANRAKLLFLGNMTHELRTPMHAVLSYAQLGRDAANAHDQRDYFDRITERGQSLLRLISNLLDLSRLESGSMSMEYAPHDIATLVQDSLQQMAPAFAAKQLSVTVQRAPDCDRCRVMVDPVRIGQLLGNVLFNAVRFSPEHGRIGVLLSRASLPSPDGPTGVARDAVEIAISDEGVGIPEKELEVIFDKFVESSKTRSNAGGLGLGLAICRAIVALHEGAIRASNNSGPGATVRVVLPLLRNVLAERGAA